MTTTGLPETSRGVRLRRQGNLVAGFGLALPVGAGALGVGLLTRSRRRGLNFFRSTWPRLLLATNGIRYRVIGAENLTAQRPAVFLYNHRNGVDPFIAAALLRDDWIKIAKKELASDPIIGTLLKFNEGVFLDRDDPAAAVETLHEVEERAKGGLSILIAPEGTSRDTMTGWGRSRRGVPDRDGRGHSDRADRDPQRRDHRRKELAQDHPGHGRRCRAAADPGRRVDAADVAGSHCRGASALSGHPRRLADGCPQRSCPRLSFTGRSETQRSPA